MSVGLPVFNGEKYLEEAIASLLRQTHEDFELIISDNASTDATPDICRTFARSDPRVRYLRQRRNHGAARNYNLLFHESRGAYFRWAAYDDICEPEYLERCLDGFRTSHPSTVLCYPRTILIDGEGAPIGYDPDGLDLHSLQPETRIRRLLRGLKLCHMVFGLIRSDVLAETGLIGSYVSSDVVLLAELGLRGPFTRVSDCLFRRRIHSGMSNLAVKNTHDLFEWFDPRNQGRLPMLHCRLFWNYLRAVWTAPIRADSKLDCSGNLAVHFARHRWRQMAGELRIALRTKMGLPPVARSAARAGRNGGRA